MVNATGLVPLTPDMVAVPAATVKLFSAWARPLGDPTLPTLTVSALFAQVVVLHAIVTKGRVVPVLSRAPVPLARVTTPVLALTVNTVIPVGAETTLPKLGVDAVIDWTVCA
jgi:hypothetical protein